jgi:hypothetical protein
MPGSLMVVAICDVEFRNILSPATLLGGKNK